MTSIDRFSQRASLLNNPKEQVDQDIDLSIPNEINPIEKKDRFSSRKEYLEGRNLIEQTDNEETERGIEHATAGMIAHGLGQVPALSGNIRDLALSTGVEAKNLRNKLLKKLGISWDESFFNNLDEKDSKGDELFTKKIDAPFKFVLDKLPNTEDVNKFIDEYAKGALAPKGEWEQIGNEFAEDVVGSVLNRGPKNLYRNLLVPGISTAVRKGMELYGASPKAQHIGKALTWIGLDLAGLAQPERMIGNMMENNRRSIPINDMINVNANDIRFLDQFEQRLTSGGSRPSSQAALTKVRELRDAITPNNQLSARRAHDFYRSINEIKTSFGAFEVEGSGKPHHVFNLNRVQNMTRNILTRYGRQQNPEFLTDFREANDAWAALKQSDQIANYVKKNYNKPFVSEGAKALFAKSNLTIPLAVGLTGLERVQSFAQRLTNPTLRRYYGNVLMHSLNDSKVSFMNNMQKLDKTMQKLGQ